MVLMCPRYAPLRQPCAVFLVAVLLLSLLCLPAPPAARAAATAYGADFARVGASWSDAGPAVPLLTASAGAGTAPEPGTVARLRDRLAAIEGQAGPYAADLQEPLASLGRALAAAGDPQGAIAAYRRALHVLRVNEGLYGEAQKPLLAALLGVYRDAGDFAALDDRYPWLFRLYGNGRPPLAGLRLEAALAYLRWQREALRRNLPDDADRRLLSLLSLGEELVARAAEDPATSWSGRRQLVFSHLRSLYLLQERVPPPLLDPLSARSMDPYRRQTLAEVDPERERLQRLQRAAPGDGRRLLESLLAPAPDARARATVQRELGDWLQWHGQDADAADHYARAFAALRLAEREDLLVAWFGEPVELPANGAFWQPAVSEELPVVEARFDVSARGRARRVAGETLSGRDSARIAVLRGLRELRFRPRLEGGRPVATPGLVRRYELYD